jgi:hypothetical protein
MAILAIGYMAVVTFVQVRATDWVTFEKQFFGRIFDAVTFCSSFMLLLGLMDEPLLRVLGDTKPFLFTAALLGFLYACFAVRPRK